MAARAAQVRWSSRRLTLWGAGTVLLAALVAWLLLLSPVLSARQVRIEGVPPDSVPAVRERASVQLGRPLLRVDTAAVRRRVLAGGGLGDVRVSRSWPSTVVIRADRRVPVLVLKNPQGQLKVVDASGVAYATVPRAPEGLPVVTVRTEEAAGGAAAPSSRQVTQQGRSAVVSVVAALPEPLMNRARDLTLSLPEDVSFRVGRVTVRWGSGSRGQEKLQVLHSLLDEPGVRKRGGSIDVSAPDSPVVRAP
jgi:cell division protein FtsQ